MSFLRSTEIVQLKRTAQNVYSKRVQRDKISKQIMELQEKLSEINSEIELWEAPIMRMTGGYTTEDLIDRVVEDTGKVDKNGNPVKVTKYVLKYPETIVPQDVEEATGSLVDDADIRVAEVDTDSHSMFSAIPNVFDGTFIQNN